MRLAMKAISLFRWYEFKPGRVRQYLSLEFHKALFCLTAALIDKRIKIFFASKPFYTFLLSILSVFLSKHLYRLDSSL